MSKEDFLPFTKPSIGEEEIADVIDSLQSGWLATGPKVQGFENALTTYFEGREAVCVSSGTAALHLSLLALDLKPGDEVITPPMTFVAAINAIVQAGGTPVFADIHEDTYNLNLAEAEKKITPKTRAILPVHFTGLCVPLDDLYALANAYNLRVIEDCAHAIGSAYKGKKVGTLGDIQIFSFHPNKNITSGEGGCIVTNDKAILERVKTLRFHGIDRNSWDRFTKNGSQLYDVLEPGYKYNMMDIQAAIGIHQLKKISTFNERRAYLATRYNKALDGLAGLALPAQDDGHAWHLYAPLVKGMNRDDFMTELKARNIGTGYHYCAAHLFTVFQDSYNYKLGDFPVAELVSNSIVSLPLFPDLSEVAQDRVISEITDIVS